MMMHFFGIAPIHKLSALFSVSGYITNRIGLKNILWTIISKLGKAAMELKPGVNADMLQEVAQLWNFMQ